MDEDREVPQHYVTAAGEQIEITETDFGQYYVDCWDGEDNNRWNRKFDKREDAFAEFDRWKHLKRPSND